MIDLHSHVLPGLDDGAEDLDEAVAMCRAAAEDGITVLAATPHVRDDYPTTPDQMERALAAVRAAAGDSVRLVGGGEIDIAQLERPRAELARFALAGNPKYLLVETPYGGWPLDLPEKLFRLLAEGITPVLAHPERNAEVQQRPDLLESIVAAGCSCSSPQASVDGAMGSPCAILCFELLERSLAHLIASDAHAPSVRAIGMSAAVAALGDEALAWWLTVGVPGAILENELLPPRPGRPGHGGRLFGR